MAMAVHRAQVGAGGVDHQGGVDVVEGTRPDLEDLAAPALLGRRADDGHPPTAGIGHRGGGQPRTQARRRR
jgi:hypothetical protein